MGVRWRIGLTVVSAIMVVICFPPVGWWGLVLLAWTPFFMVVRELGSRRAFFYGLLHGGISFTLAVSWLGNLYSIWALALWAVLALFTGCWSWIYAKLHSNGTRAIPLLAAILFTGMEYLRGEFFILSFPWITPGTALPPNLITPLLGTYGVSFLVVLSSLLLVHPGKKTELTGLAIALSLLGAIWLMPAKTETEAGAVRVALVQNESRKMGPYLDQSSVLPGYVDIIVWPEYALASDPRREPEIQTEITDLLRKRAQLLVAGGPTWHDDTGETWSNTAYTFTSDGILSTHFKNHPVHLLDDGVPGTEAKAFDSNLGRIGTPICFDCDHQNIVRKMTGDGAELFLVPAMNRKEWSKREHLQQAVHARHRAAENGRWIAVASTSGVTQVIDAYGNVVKKLPLMKPNTLTAEVYFESRETFFQRGGWLTGPLLALLATLILLVAAVKRVRGKLSENERENIDSIDSGIKKSDKHPLPPKSFYD